MMIHQMMLLMHLEMQLRQQALVSYQEAQDPAQRMQRLDDVMALNEQLNEVGSILGVLLNAPLDRGASLQLAATSTESPPASHRSTSIMGGRFTAPATDESALGTSLPRFRFQVLDIDSDDDDDDDDGTSVGEVTDGNLSYASSNVAETDSEDLFDEDFGRMGGSSGNSVWNSQSFDSLASSSHRQARNTVNAGITAFTGVNNGTSQSSVVGGTGTNDQQAGSAMRVPSSVASNGHLSVLSRRRDRPVTPRTTVEQSPLSVTVNELHLPAGLRSQTVDRSTPSMTVTLPQIQSPTGGVARASQTPRTPNGDHVLPAMSERQSTVFGSSRSTLRQLEPVSRNRSSVMPSADHCSTLVGVTNNHPALPASTPVTSCTSGASSNASHQLNFSSDSSQPSADGSGVLTEPWPVLPVFQQHTSASVSTYRPAVVQPAARPDESRLSHGHGSYARSVRPSVTTISTRGPRGSVQDVHNYHPALPLRRSSVRNALGRPAGPTLVSTLRQSGPHSSRMVPLPHPPVRSGRQQGVGGHSTAASRGYALSLIHI